MTNSIEIADRIILNAPLMPLQREAEQMQLARDFKEAVELLRFIIDEIDVGDYEHHHKSALPFLSRIGGNE